MIDGLKIMKANIHDYLIYFPVQHICDIGRFFLTPKITAKADIRANASITGGAFSRPR